MTSKINIFKKFKGATLLVFALFIALSGKLLASEPDEASAANHDTHAAVADADAHATDAHAAEAHGEEGKVDITKVAFEHILDSHSWHFWGEGHDAVAMPLPIYLFKHKRLTNFFFS